MSRNLCASTDGAVVDIIRESRAHFNIRSPIEAFKKKRKDLAKAEMAESVMESDEDGSLVTRWYYDSIRLRGIGTVEKQAIRGKRVSRRGVDKRRSDRGVRWEVGQRSKE